VEGRACGGLALGECVPLDRRCSLVLLCKEMWKRRVQGKCTRERGMIFCKGVILQVPVESNVSVDEDVQAMVDKL